MDLGQLFLAGFDGTAVDESHQVVESIVRHGLGGVILFDRNVDGSRQNIESPHQLQKLTSDLQRFGKGSLLIGVDQEGGRVCRLKEQDGFPSSVPAAEYASFTVAEMIARFDLLAQTLKENGINFNLAPVVDLDLEAGNPIIGAYKRSYGRDPQRVFELASRFIEVHHARGIACCLKHFPGHGSARADSHLGFVDITDYWQEQELLPYELLIENGYNDGVMTAHVVHGGLDEKKLPATLSPAIVTRLLREKLGFAGIVVSDDLQMKAISDRWSYEEAVQMAVQAGVDLLIVGNNLVRTENAVQRGILAITELLDSGRVREDQINDSLARVMQLKQQIAGAVPWKKYRPIT